MIKTDWVPTLEDKEKERIIEVLKKTENKKRHERIDEVADHISTLLYKKEAYQYWPKRTKYGKNWIYEIAKRAAQDLVNRREEIKKEHIQDILENSVLSVHKENFRKGFLNDLHDTLKKINMDLRRRVR